jgi:outer membrane receptor protein involved in Fe transport
MKKHLKLFVLAVFAVVSFVFVTASMAQSSTTGTVEGTISDPNGAVVPNATVTLSGPNLIRPLTTTSDSNGSYRFSQVPPGRYTLETAAASGFAAFKQDNVEVNLTKSTSVNISVRAAGSNVSVDVVATPEIDQTTNVQGSNVSTEFFSNIPTSRTVQGLYTIAPTVARSGLRDASGRDRDPSVAGSSGPENSYILDGVTTTDPAFGGGGANLPFEFVQEVQIKTGGYGADQGLSTGGVFNVITKSGGNEFHGDVFAYVGNKHLVANTKNFSQTGSSPNGYSDIDAGVDIGGPIIKNRLTFFAAFNPQYRTNYFVTQTFRTPVQSKVRTPFYSGKVSWVVNNSNTFTFSTFGDFTRQKGHLFGGSGFGVDENAFQGTQETGGTNYAFRLNSNIKQNWIGEFSFGIHRQRNNVIPASPLTDRLITDNFAILNSAGQVVPVTQTGVNAPSTNIGQVDYVFSPGGSIQRNFVRSDGFGLYQNQSRNRLEGAARLQNIWDQHTVKYGFEWYQNAYNISQLSTGPSGVFANPLNVGFNNGSDLANRTVSGIRVTNNFTVCTTRIISGVGTVVCPTSTSTAAFNALPLANRPAGFTADAIQGTITPAELNNNPFLIRSSTRVRDFELVAKTKTRVESFYVQDDWRLAKNLQLNIGVRWDLQQAYGDQGVTYLKLNNLWDDLAPRLGFAWDPWGKGRAKIFANYSRFVETPLPLDVNVRAGSDTGQTDKNFNVNTYGAPLSATIATGFNTRNLGAEHTPIDGGLKPQTVNEWTAGFEYQLKNNLTFGFRGIYRAQGSVIEDGSFNDGDSYFLFNPGEPIGPGGANGPLGNTEFISGLPPCGDLDGDGDPTNEPGYGATCGGVGQYFGRARRFYRALEFTLNRRFSNNVSFNASYVFSSLIGNYEGLFRNDNGQSDPNITSLFDLVSLLNGMYGRLPNDRPHQFKFNGSYQTPFKLVVSGNFYAQSGIPFNALVPHPVYGNNEGFCVASAALTVCHPRGTAIVPDLGANSAGVTSAIGKNRTPFTWNLDLGVYYPIKLSERMQLRFTADWFNVTNSQRAVTLDNTFLINSGVSGVNPVSNPFWGSGTIFQYPSALRLGAKFTF